MKILRLTKSFRPQNLSATLAVMVAVTCFGLASFVINPSSASANNHNRTSYLEFMDEYDFGNTELVLKLGEHLMGHDIWGPYDEDSGLYYAINNSDLPTYAEKLEVYFEQLAKDRARAAEIRRIIRQRMREQQQQQQQTTTETESTTPDDKSDTSSEPAKTDPPTEHTDNPKTQPESEATSSSPDNHNYRTPLPLITSRPLPGPSSTRPETTEESDIQAEPEAAPQPDQNQPVETDSGNIDSVDEPQAPEVVTSPPSEATAAILLDVAPTDQPIGQPGDPTQISSGTSNVRPVLWGIVAAMSTLLVLGSLIFRSQDRE